MNGLAGKRFVYAVVACVCASIVTIILKYPALEYVKLMGLITGIFTIGQSFTDLKEVKPPEQPK